MNLLKTLNLIAFIIVFNAVSAYAGGTPITNDMAVKYYDQCLTNSAKDGTMYEENAKAFCQCTAQNMKNRLSQEDLNLLQEQGQGARDVVNRILIYVNGPCMSYPINDLVLRKCINDIGNDKTCACLSKGISTYITSESQKLMAGILERDPNIADPLGAIMDSAAYKMQENKIAMQCAMGQ